MTGPSLHRAGTRQCPPLSAAKTARQQGWAAWVFALSRTKVAQSFPADGSKQMCLWTLRQNTNVAGWRSDQGGMGHSQKPLHK
jgi:hypothetical protein